MSTQSGPLFAWPVGEALDAVGVTIPGAELSFFLTDSDTPAVVYSDGDLGTPLTQPVVADSAGRFVPIYLDSAITYKVVHTGPDNGIDDPLEIWTVDPYKGGWPSMLDVFWDAPLEFLGGSPPAASEIMGMYVAARPQRIFGNFDGTGSGYAKAVGFCFTPPAADFVCSIFLNGTVTLVGFMNIDTGGAFQFLTDAGAPLDLDTGDCLVFRAQVTPDTDLADLSWTITGINL